MIHSFIKGWLKLGLAASLRVSGAKMSDELAWGGTFSATGDGTWDQVTKMDTYSTGWPEGTPGR